MDHPSEWGLDPLFWSHVKLTVADIQRHVRPNDQFLGSFSLLSHPIKNVEVRGVIVYKRVWTERAVYTLDDGTGLLTCNEWANDGRHGDVGMFQLGEHVSFFGKLSYYRSHIELAVSAGAVQTDMDAETVFMFEVLLRFQCVYTRPCPPVPVACVLAPIPTMVDSQSRRAHAGPSHSVAGSALSLPSAPFSATRFLQSLQAPMEDGVTDISRLASAPPSATTNDSLKQGLQSVFTMPSSSSSSSSVCSSVTTSVSDTDMVLVPDALVLQSCRPVFLQVRDDERDAGCI